MATKVLIVEDDNNIAQLLQLYLEKEGFETRTAPDGGKGVEEFRAWDPDLVLLDLIMPGLDGMAKMKEIMAQRVQEENAQMETQNAALSEQSGGAGNAMPIM